MNKFENCAVLQALLRHAVGEACYPDQQCTPLVQLSQEVVRTLLDAGCTNQAAVVAAALGDLPYSRTMWRDQVQHSILPLPQFIPRSCVSLFSPCSKISR